MNICIIDFCEEKVRCLNLCNKHYQKYHKYGDANYKTKIRNSKHSGREQICLHCKKLFYVAIWEDKRCKERQRFYCSEKCKHLDKIIFMRCFTCDKILEIYKWKIKRSPNSNFFCNKKCHVEYQRTLIGNKNSNYKGISTEETRLRKIDEYSEWRNSVYKRDNYTCQRCFSYGGKLNAHHILYFMKYSIFRFDIDNGITLCKDCHKYLHKVKSKSYIRNKHVEESKKDIVLGAKRIY